METSSNANPVPASLYNYAANLYFVKNKNSYEVKTALMEQGLDENQADKMIDELESRVQDVRLEKARKDMLYGGLWFAGGVILTAANIGFIFWGAILFGGIQFFRGLSNSRSS